MRRLVPHLAAGSLLALLIAVPHAALAASSPFFGPIISEACRCPGLQAPSYGCVLDTISRVINFGVSLGIVIFTLSIAYTGFVWMTNASNPEARNKARSMLLNVIIGLVILLTAWLVVDFIMKKLYDSDQYGPWNSILAAQGGDQCIQTSKPKELGGLIGGGITGELGGTGGQLAPAPSGPGYTGTKFSYDPGISAQRGDASNALAGVLSCMEKRLPQGVGRISSISDSAIANGTRTFAQCAASGCAHTAHSCHYGGTTCVGKSYAVDFGDERNTAALTQAAQACGAKTLNEGNHLHVSIGAASGCGCSL